MTLTQSSALDASNSRVGFVRIASFPHSITAVRKCGEYTSEKGPFVAWTPHARKRGLLLLLTLIVFPPKEVPYKHGSSRTKQLMKPYGHKEL